MPSAFIELSHDIELSNRTKKTLGELKPNHSSELQANRNQITLAPKRTMTQRSSRSAANTTPLKTPKSRKSNTPTSKRKQTSISFSSGSASFLTKLSTLREFTSHLSNITETKLSQTLRSCGYNVERAAETLLLGGGSCDDDSGGGFARGSTPDVNRGRSVMEDIINIDSEEDEPDTVGVNTSLKNAPTSTSARAVVNPERKRKAQEDSSSSHETAPPTPSPKLSPEVIPKERTSANRLLLCRRWIVGCCTTPKPSRIGYKEPLHFEFSSATSSRKQCSIVRFRSRNSEGTLPPNLSGILSPLREFIELSGETLMEDSRLVIGSDVPLVLEVWITNVIGLFALWKVTDTENNSVMKMIRGGKRNVNETVKNEGRLRLAGMELLRWSHHGGDVLIEEPQHDVDNNHDKEEEEEEVVLKEEELMVEESDAPQVLGDVTATSLDDGLETPTDMKQKGVELKCYQKQALHWMTTREDAALTEDDGLGGLLKELLEDGGEGRTALVSDSREPTGNMRVECDCGPVTLQPSTNSSVTFLTPNLQPFPLSDTQKVSPHLHPLWQRGYFTNPAMDSVLAYYVNPFLQTASLTHPHPPQSARGGILADSMGLGKTIMLLALISSSRSNSKAATNGESGGSTATATLVVTPLSLLHQWEEEIATKTDLTHYVHYNDSIKHSTSTDNSTTFHEAQVVLTTYGTLQGEALALSRHQSNNNTKSTSPTSTPARKKPRPKPTPRTPLLTKSWNRVILDEAHVIKNSATVLSKSTCALKSKFRWCVTGTPMQNSLEDVYGLLKFLRHEPWCDAGFWNLCVSRKMKEPTAKGEDGTNTEEGMNVALGRVRQLLTPILLRRTKHTLTKQGTPILTLPPVDTQVIQVTFSPSEQLFYQELLNRSQTVFDGFVRRGTASKSWFAIFSLLNRLRQACDHVALTVQNRLGQEKKEEKVNAGSDATGVRNCRTGRRNRKHDGNNITNTEEAQTNMNINQEEISTKGDTIPTVDESATGSQHPASHDDNNSKEVLDDKFVEGLLQMFYAPPEPPPQDQQHIVEEEEEPSTSSTNGTTMVYASQVAESLKTTMNSNATHVSEECPICLEYPKVSQAVLTPCAHYFCRDCLLGVMTTQHHQHSVRKSLSSQSLPEEAECPVCNATFRSDRIIALSSDTATTHEKDKNNSNHTYQINNKLDRHKNSNNNNNDSHQARKTLEQSLLHGANSAKTLAVMSELEKVWDQDPRSKVLIFSQFLGFLDIMEMCLDKKHIPYDRLDGKLSLKERLKVLNNFNHDDSTPYSHPNTNTGSVLLISMKAGGVGLNLVAASSVFIVDPWWNAAVEDQCIHRIHRLGQKAKIVRVRKFVVESSVEEKIVRLQMRKKSMAGRVLQDDGGDKCAASAGGESSLNLDDFKDLFGR